MKGWEDVTEKDLVKLKYKSTANNKPVAKKKSIIDINRPKSKYNAIKTVIGNLKFDSKKEANYYLTLKAKRINGEIRSIKLQPEFLILRGFTLENGERIKGIKYVADFEVEYADGHKEIIDVKGVKTEAYKIKKKMLLDMYPNINFIEV